MQPVLSYSLQIERSSTTRPMILPLDPFEMVHPAPTITPAQVCYFEKRSYFVGKSFYSIESHSWSCLSKSATSLSPSLQIERSSTTLPSNPEVLVHLPPSTPRQEFQASGPSTPGNSSPSSDSRHHMRLLAAAAALRRLKKGYWKSFVPSAPSFVIYFVIL